MVILSFLFLMVAVFVTLTERSTGETFDKDCSNVRPLDIYPTYNNLSCYYIEDRIDPTSSFDRIIMANERRPIRATSTEDFLDKISQNWGDEDSIAFHTINFRGTGVVFNRMIFETIHRVHEGTFLCPGSFVRFHANRDGSLCIHISDGRDVHAKMMWGVPSLIFYQGATPLACNGPVYYERGYERARWSERFWLNSQVCKTGSKSWLSPRAVKYGAYAVYPDVYQCPSLEIVFPANGVISALPGERVSLQLELADEVTDYTITCEDEHVPNATISEDGLVSWNVSSNLNSNFQASAKCEIETHDGLRRSVNITFQIFQCDCSGHGTCRLAINATGGSGNYVCECDSGYEGSRCEIDIDECASNPCYPNVMCVNFNAMYWCMDCPPGMEGDGFDCTEIASTSTESLTSTSSTLPTNPSPVEDPETTTESIDLLTYSNATELSSHSPSPTLISSTTTVPAVTEKAHRTSLHSKTVWAMLLLAISIINIVLGF